jgi:hypothetical protein
MMLHNIQSVGAVTWISWVYHHWNDLLVVASICLTLLYCSVRNLGAGKDCEHVVSLSWPGGGFHNIMVSKSKIQL